MLGTSSAADEATVQARGAGASERVALLAAAARACRERAELAERRQPIEAAGPDPGDEPPTDVPEGELARAVAQELAEASAALPERQREVLALRELLQFPHAEIAAVMDIEQAAVAPLLSRARLRLRSQRRGPYAKGSMDCPEPDRALRALTLRQDGEPLPDDETEWLAGHVAACPGCQVAHAAMLEASVCYRAWPQQQPRSAADVR